MRWTYDANVDAIYVYLSDARPVRQEEMPGGMVVDLDAEGHAVGIEVIGRGAEPLMHDELERLDLPQEASDLLLALLTSPLPSATWRRKAATDRAIDLPHELLHSQ